MFDILVSGFMKSLIGIGRRGGKGREGMGWEGRKVLYIYINLVGLMIC